MNPSNGDLTTLNREELYERVWKTPASKLAKEFGISDVGLAKVCKRHQIPRPPRGYWAQLAVGKRVRKPTLPPVDDGALEEVRIFRQQFFGDASLNSDTQPATQIAIQVAESLDKPHPLVDRARRYLRAAKAGNDKILPPDGTTCLQIGASRASLDRSLRIFDAFIKHWESLGGSVVVGKIDINRKPTTDLQLHGDSVPVELYEETDRISTQRTDVCRNWKYHNCKYEPTGQLVFKVDAYSDARRTRWADGKRQRLETMLGAISDGLVTILETKRLRRLDDECEARQKAVVKAVREAAAKRKELMEARRTRLLEEVNAWKQAGEIRSYLATIHTKLDAGDLRVSDMEKFEAWTDWAAWYADSIDPLTATPPRTEFAVTPTKAVTSELDLTRKTRAIVAQLGVSNTDELFEVEHAAVEKLCGPWRNSEWNEMCRVLEGLGYDVSNRYRGYGF